MKRIGIGTMALISVMALTLAYVHSQPPGTHAPVTDSSAAKQQLKMANTVATQQRLNHHFHGDVVPKLKTCWEGVNGKGDISFKYTYTKARSGRWMFEKLAVESSTLPAGQDAVALKCMQNSVSGASFPVEEADATETTYTIHWSWPVPFPVDAEQQKKKMFAAVINGGGLGAKGGCDGHGAAASCLTCDPDSSGSCVRVCVGSDSCTVSYGAGGKGNHYCQATGKCAAGGGFGVISGGGYIALMGPLQIEMFDPVEDDS